MIAKIKELTEKLIETPNCYDGLKEEAKKWLKTIGTENEQTELKNYYEYLKSSIIPIDGLIEFANSCKAKEILGDKQEWLINHANELKKSGAKYCDCDACKIANEIIKLIDTANNANNYKFVVIVNKELESNIGKAMNAIAHSVAGLASSAPTELKEKMSFIDYVDADNSSHKNISALSLIVLKGKNGEIKKARHTFEELRVHYTDFIETMTGYTYQEQLIKTSETKEEDMKYYCIAAFGKKEVLDTVTKKFSLWK